MKYTLLLIETNNGVAQLTINSPQTLNALNSAVLDEIECALYELDRDDDVKVVILTGAGEKAFVAGADIKEMAAMSAFEAQQFSLKGQRVILMIEKMKKPVIAAVNGYALGGGLELALGCDFIYASEKARFGFPEVTLGIIPGFGGTQNLSRRIGMARANELIFTGQMIDAHKATEWGIVNEIFAPKDLLSKALETAQSIAEFGAPAISLAKNAIANGLNMGKEDGFRYEASMFGVLFSTEDQKEGMGAFVEKRKPEFKGK